MFSTSEGKRAGVAATVAVAALLALPGAAKAEDLNMCDNLWGGPIPDAIEFQIRSAGLGIVDFGGVATEALGAQYGQLWVNDQRRGWSVAIAPGPLDVDAAKAAISQRIDARLNPEQAAFLKDRLSVWETPYSYADLQAVQNQVFAALQTVDQGWGLQSTIGCVPAEGAGAVDAWRVRATLYTGDVDPSEDLVARAQALVEPFGEKVSLKVTRGDGRVFPAPGVVPATPAQPVQPAPALGSKPAPLLRFSRYVSLPNADRCVRGRTLTVKAHRRADLRRLKVTAPTRTVTLRAGKSARIKLASARKTTLTLALTLRNGDTATLPVTFRRCR